MLTPYLKLILKFCTQGLNVKERSKGCLDDNDDGDDDDVDDDDVDDNDDDENVFN